MKKYVLFTLLLLSFTLMLSACSQSEEEKIRVHLEDYSFYDILVDLTDGGLNIEVQMFETSDNDMAQVDVVVETKALLEAVKKYSEVNLDVIKEVNLYFVTRETNITVAEINANIDTISGTNWNELDRYELPQIVDGYKFYGVSN
ncbi:hypothetical protein WAX74_20040 [Psychrobacillus sp. FJAT-51614]|uniref:Uncharacterized protein n=1 Tax=Psychrobacillus mangrovi TaxID=3117745 RepID=A0ABU8FC87_9BACI